MIGGVLEGGSCLPGGDFEGVCGGRTEGLALSSAGRASRSRRADSPAASPLELLRCLLPLLERVLLALFLSLCLLLRVLLCLLDGLSGSRGYAFEELVCLPSSSASVGLLSFLMGLLGFSSSRFASNQALSGSDVPSSVSALPGPGDGLVAGLLAFEAAVFPASSCSLLCSWNFSASSCKIEVQMRRLLTAHARSPTGRSSHTVQKRVRERQKVQTASVSPDVRRPQSRQSINTLLSQTLWIKTIPNAVVLITGVVTSYIVLSFYSVEPNGIDSPGHKLCGNTL